MTRTVEGSMSGEGLHVGVAVARWNQGITDRLLAGAKARLAELGVTEVTVFHVPGALELPVGARALVEQGVDAVVAIGTVIRGDTDHYEIVVRESAAGISRVALDTGVPVSNAILAVHEYEQALERAGSGRSNKGSEAVDAAVLMATGLRELRRS